MAKAVECSVCGKFFALTDADYSLASEIHNSLEDLMDETAKKQKPKFMCKSCKKYIGQV